MKKSFKAEILSNGYVERAGLVSVRNNKVHTDTFDPDQMERRLLSGYLFDHSLALSRLYNVAVIKIRHPKEVSGLNLNPDLDISLGGRLSTQEFKPFLPVQDKTRFVTGFLNSGIPVFNSKKEILKQRTLTDHMVNSLGNLAFTDGWRNEEMDDFLPLLPGKPDSLQAFQSNLMRVGVEQIIDMNT